MSQNQPNVQPNVVQTVPIPNLMVQGDNEIFQSEEIRLPTSFETVPNTHVNGACQSAGSEETNDQPPT